MRFIGNKELITKDIKTLLKTKGLLGQNLIFFDAFCGTGSVSNYFKNEFDIKINDMINWSSLYSKV